MTTESQARWALEQARAARDRAHQAYLRTVEQHGASCPESARAWQLWMDRTGEAARADDRLLAIVVNARNAR